jgi:DNA-binding response OmpR family regulator
MTKIKKIMVVDDEPNIRNLLFDALSDKGYRVSLAKDGQDSLNQLRNQRFDLLITDVEMPRVDGIALLKKMKRAGRMEKVIVMTGESTKQDDLRKQIPAATPLLFKPFQMSKLLDIISLTLRLRNGQPIKKRIHPIQKEKEVLHAV